jgi:hypothetical protein
VSPRKKYPTPGSALCSSSVPDNHASRGFLNILQEHALTKFISGTAALYVNV